MLSFQSFSLTKKPLCHSLLVEDGVIEVAKFLPPLYEQRVNLNGSLVTRPPIVETSRTTLRAKLYEITANAPKPRRLREYANRLVGKSNGLQRRIASPWPLRLQLCDVV